MCIFRIFDDIVKYFVFTISMRVNFIMVATFWMFLHTRGIFSTKKPAKLIHQFAFIQCVLLCQFVRLLFCVAQGQNSSHKMQQLSMLHRQADTRQAVVPRCWQACLQSIHCRLLFGLFAGLLHQCTNISNCAELPSLSNSPPRLSILYVCSIRKVGCLCSHSPH